MTELYRPIAELLERVRTRWRRLVAYRAIVRSALAATAALAIVLIPSYWVTQSPAVLALLAVSGVMFIVAALVWGLLPIRESPSDARIARFIEERRTELDERLVSAVSVVNADREGSPPALADSMVRDAARRAESIDAAEIVAADLLRRTGFQASAAVLVFLAVAFLARDKVRQSYDAVSLAVFPSRVVLEVTPGDVRIPTGSNLVVEARLVGNRAPVIAQLLRAEGDADAEWRAAEMTAPAEGHFALSLNALTNSFRYRVVAGGVTSKTYTVAVVRPPRVTRIDVEYSYPRSLGLARRVEKDGGDIYAPAGTDVGVLVYTDVPASSGRMVMGDGGNIELATAPDGRLRGALRVAEDGSYRVALADSQGLSSRGDTEYFIRTLEDRPPEVHVVRPASDRRVTRLEEVTIEAEATDDFGVESLDLVYAVRGGAQKVVPLTIPRSSTSVSGRHILYLEDLSVAPGDFVSYYVRARDLARGKRSSEARSDIFFLEVKPFEEEFTLAQTQAAMGGGQSSAQIDDLVAAQKQIIVATWKLDRRSQAAQGAQSAEDIRSVAHAEDELKTRVEQASSAFRQSTMRDPRSRPNSGRGGQARPPQPGPRAGQTLAEEDAMSLAAAAMGEAVKSLEALKTAAAVPSEMEALNQLLKAQADVKQRQIQQQQAGGGSGGNRSSQDMSSLFDKELARHQQTNYETPKKANEENKQGDSALDKIRDLARRQDELLKRQQDLARDRDQLTPEELKRQLESLTREQNDLRQRAEELAQQIARQEQEAAKSGQTGQQQNQSGQTGQSAQQQGQGGQQQGQANQAGQGGQAGQSGQPRPGQQPGQPGQAGQAGQAGQESQAGQNGQAGQSGKEMRDISEEMRNATANLRREDAAQASARAARALEKLRELEREMQASSPDGRRRALGDLQLEARQLADAERQIGSEANRARQTPSSEASRDAFRRLAGEQDRLADRLGRIQQGLKQQGTSGAQGKGDADIKSLQQAAAEASRQLERERVGERMQQSADALRAAGQADAQGANGTPPRGSSSPSASPSQEDIARALDRLADSLANAERSGSDDSRKISGQLARAQELRQRLNELTGRLSQLDQQAGAQSGQQPGGRSGQAQGGQSSSQRAPGDTGRSGQGQGGSGGTGGDLAELRESVNREIQQVRELVDELRREDASYGQGGAGFTFEGQGMTLSAPGTEAFKQDFAKWQELKRQATAALEQAESTLARKLQDRNAKDRLATGADDKAPAEYQQQVDSYFKALATRKKP